MPEIFLRKCEIYTAKRCSDPVKIDVEKLRECNPPYKGNSHKELLNYLEEHVFYNEDWWQENEKVYKDEVIVGEELYIENEYFDSRTKGANEWFEIGIPNKDYGKNGFFQTIESNDS